MLNISGFIKEINKKTIKFEVKSPLNLKNELYDFPLNDKVRHKKIILFIYR